MKTRNVITTICTTALLYSPWLTAQQTEDAAAPPDDAVITLEKFITEGSSDDPFGILPEKPVRGSFGFAKTSKDTPRSISLVSAEMIDVMAISAVEDLVRIVPGVFTVTRFGIQGSIDVRNVPGDTYFRGMKRINLQGHGRTVLAAMDEIEVVKGPPSPIYGMGKIGGYTNMVPKAGRAKTGAYLENIEATSDITIGSYNKFEATFGVGGPLSVGKKQGGFYLYALYENSDAYMKDVSVDQKILQGAISLEDAIGPFRMEAGFSYQLGSTQGAFPGRLTQDWIDNGVVLGGSPLVDLDANGNGKIGYYELNRGSPVSGRISSSNQSLRQRVAWPKDVNGNYYPLGQFPTVSGIPQTMYDYLVANPEADPSGLLRAQGVGGVLPTSGQLPIGFVMDPRTVALAEVDYRQPSAYEHDLEAEFIVGYFDLINDRNPNFTLKNQLFFDSQDQAKNSGTPSGGKQDVYVVEDKFTLTKRFLNTPEWLQLNSLTSVNLRNTRATGYRYGGDFGGGYRVDPTAENVVYGHFEHPFDNDDIENDGAPWTSRYRTDYTEYGAGMLFDIDVASQLNFIVGGRWDGSQAENTDYASFNANTGTSASPGAMRTSDASAKGWDSGPSWSASVTYKGFDNIRPYFSTARSSLSLEGNNNKFANNVIAAGHIGEGELLEAGVKASLLNDTLFLTVAAYEQTRSDITPDSDSSLISVEVTSTKTRGAEFELKWSPHKKFSFSTYALTQKTVYTPPTAGRIWLNASTLGFQDVVDPSTGEVIYDADAFGFGGKLDLIVPAEIAAQYNEKQGLPENQFGMNMFYTPTDRVGFSLSANYFASTYSGRYLQLKLPPTRIVNAGVFYRLGDDLQWRVKLDLFNIFDDLSFRARSGGDGSETLLTVNPARRWQFSVSRSF